MHAMGAWAPARMGLMLALPAALRIPRPLPRPRAGQEPRRWFAARTAEMALGGCFRAPHRLQPSPTKSVARSEASAGNHSESASAAAGAPPPELSQLVRRKISLPQPLFERLDAQEKADRLLAQGPRGRWSSW